MTDDLIKALQKELRQANSRIADLEKVIAAYKRLRTQEQEIYAKIVENYLGTEEIAEAIRNYSPDNYP